MRPKFLRPEFSRPLFTKPPQRGNKDEVKLFREWLGERDVEHDLIVYSDSSQIKDQGVTVRAGAIQSEKAGLHRKSTKAEADCFKRR